MKLDVWVGSHVSDLDTRLCVDQERLGIPQEPNRHSLWSAIATGGYKPDHQLFLEAAQRMFARRNHNDKYRNDGCVIPGNVLAAATKRHLWRTTRVSKAPTGSLIDG